MSDGFKDKVNGTVDKAKGEAKDRLGKATDDYSKQAEGKADKAKGEIKKKVGGLKDRFDDDGKR